MNALKCELCGGVDFIKDEEFFVCQHCRTKYTPEAARKIMIDGSVEVYGTVEVDRSKEVENILQNAHGTFSVGNFSEAFSLYSQALNINPNNAYATMYRGIASGKLSTAQNDRTAEVLASYARAIPLKHSEVGDTEEFFEFALDAESEISSILLQQKDLYDQALSKLPPVTDKKKLPPGYAEAQNAFIDSLKKCYLSVMDMIETLFKISNDIANMNAQQFERLIKLLETCEKDMNRKGVNRSNFNKDDKARIARLLEISKNAKQERLNRDMKIYWAEHPDEYQLFLAKQERIKPLEGRIAALNAESDSLGMLKVKEKREISKEIDQLKLEIEKINNENRSDKKTIGRLWKR